MSISTPALPLARARTTNCDAELHPTHAPPGKCCSHSSLVQAAGQTMSMSRGSSSLCRLTGTAAAQGRIPSTAARQPGHMRPISWVLECHACQAQRRQAHSAASIINPTPTARALQLGHAVVARRRSARLAARWLERRDAWASRLVLAVVLWGESGGCVG
jgi:hypothetical protein